MNITVLLIDIALVFILTFIYSSFRISSKEALEEYEKDYN